MSGSSSERTMAERITVIISLIILLATFGVAGWVSIRSGDEPPMIQVEANLAEVREADSRFYVPITVTNEGGLTGQDVIVTGELDTGEGEPETAEITLTFLAGGESEQAELIFSSDPNDADFTVGPTSYIVP